MTGQGAFLYSPASDMSASPFHVLLRDLPTHRTVDVDAAFVARAIAGMAVREALEPPEDDPDAGGGVVDVDVYADGDTVFAAGRIRGTARVACGRCVGPVDVAFDEPVRVTFMPRAQLEADAAAAAAAGADDEGAELAEDDLDLYPYDGDAVDLEPLVREQFVLAVPFAPLCKDDCRGLCPQCGVDLNQATCRCEAPIDPRFEALKGLKLPS